MTDPLERLLANLRRLNATLARIQRDMAPAPPGPRPPPVRTLADFHREHRSIQ